MAKKLDPGKEAEAEVEAWLQAKSNADRGFAYHRLPDARAARGAIAAQPSDFYTMSGGRFLHLEVKETAELYRLPKAKISQWSDLKKFAWAGGQCLVVVKRSAYGDWTWFTGDDLFGYETVPASFPFVKDRHAADAASILKIRL